MRSLFRSKHRVTQEFGVNKDYYKQFGLQGHEGLDLVPTGSVWDVLCLADGVVVKDQDDAIQGKNYGKYVTVWHPSLHKATQYCHLKENYVKLGDVLSYGDKIGLMGTTGNVTGAHVHLNLFDVDDSGVRINKDNGFLGGVNPLPFLEEDVSTPPEDQVCMSQSQADDFNRVKLGWNQVRELLNVSDSVDAVIAEIKKLIDMDDKLVAKEKQLTDAQTELNMVRGELLEEQEKNTALAKEASELTKKATELEVQYGISLKTIEKALAKNAELQEQLKHPVSGWAKIIEGIYEVFGIRR